MGTIDLCGVICILRDSDLQWKEIANAVAHCERAPMQNCPKISKMYIYKDVNTPYFLQIWHPLFWDPGIFRIFIKMPHYDILQTNGTFNMDHHNIIYALPQELPYLFHFHFIKCT